MTARMYPQAFLRQRFARAAQDADVLQPIYTEIADRLCQRLLATKRDFNLILDAGAGTGSVSAILHTQDPTRHIVATDLSLESLKQHPEGSKVCLDLEAPLPFKNGQFDLVVSNLTLHWIDNVPKALLNLGRCLKKDGLFLASTLGVESFHELRTAFADIGDEGGHILPLTDVQSAGSVLQKVGFSLPVIDRDIITIHYSNFENMYRDLRLAGGNLNPNRRKSLSSPSQLKAMEAAYRKRFETSDGKLPLTLEVLYLHGWRPHESQQKPLAPGSATVDLTDVLKTLPSQKS